RFHWIDPFDPATERRVRAWARRLVAPYRGDPRRIGYFTDNEVGWWNGALFDYYAKRPAANRTKQRLVALLREHYAGDWDRFARYYFEGLRQLTGGKPVLVSEWFFAAGENRSGNRNNGHLMTVGTQAERARGAAAAAERFARQPTVVGSHWFQYYDHPRGGREDGEDYDFGLVDIDDRPYEQLVDALARTNVRLAAIHRNSADADRPASGGAWAIPRADIDPGDRSLGEWPKEAALVPGLATPGAEVPFGEFFLAWSRE